MTSFGDCTFCGGEVQLKRIEYDYRRRGRPLVICNVPVGVCRQWARNTLSRTYSRRWTMLTTTFLTVTKIRSAC